MRISYIIDDDDDKDDDNEPILPTWAALFRGAGCIHINRVFENDRRRGSGLGFKFRSTPGTNIMRERQTLLS